MKEELFREPFGFSFFQAVRLLEDGTPGAIPLGDSVRPRDEAVNFTVPPGFVFPASDVVALARGVEGSPARMAVAFMGLVGPSGVLPHWYNELARERNRQKDFSLTSFLDLFHHRLLSLFYLAWKGAHPEAAFRQGCADPLSACLLSLQGFGTGGLAERLGFSPEDLVFCGGLLSRGVPSASALEGVVEYFSGSPARVEQFLPREIRIDPEDQTRLGMANASLGADALCGSLVRDRQSAIRIHLGPMGHDRFSRFLPGESLSREIFSLVRTAVGIQYDCDLRVVLRRDEVPPCVLGGAESAPLLGWSAWIASPGFDHAEDPAMVIQQSERH